MQRPLLKLLILIAMFPCAAAWADTPVQCDVHLLVHLTPDVPDLAAAGFLSSLLTNPNFRWPCWARAAIGTWQWS